MQFLNKFCVLLAIPYAINAIELTRCSVFDSACLLIIMRGIMPEIASGIPEIGTRRLDPLRLPSMIVKHYGLTCEVENFEARGLKKAVIDKTSFDKFSKQLRLRFTIPTFTVNGTITASGFVRSLPFNGKGGIYIRVDNLEIDTIMDYELREDAENKKYIELKNYFYTFDTLGEFSISLNNFSGGHELMSDSVQEYIQKNGRVISAEYGRIYLAPFMEVFFNAMKQVVRFKDVETFIKGY